MEKKNAPVCKVSRCFLSGDYYTDSGRNGDTGCISLSTLAYFNKRRNIFRSGIQTLRWVCVARTQFPGSGAGLGHGEAHHVAL